MDEHPVTLAVEDELRRSRLTVFFRLLLAIPHLIWFGIWTVGAFVAAIVAWVLVLVRGELPEPLHRFFCSYIRYTVHLAAYISLVADPYPNFTGVAGSYPVDVGLPGPTPLSRGRVAVRLVLALPALILSSALCGAPSVGAGSRGGDRSAEASAGGVLSAIAFLGWFASLFTGRMPRGLRDAGAYSLGYLSQTLAYLVFVTDRYPSADPTALLAQLEPPPRHPVRLVGDSDDLRRSRLTVFFRLPLAIPLYVWLLLWSIAAFFAVIAQWFVTLVRGVPAAPLQRFLASYVRFGFRVGAFFFLAANPFPGFGGASGHYPLDLELPQPGPQNRWKTGFRLILCVPAVVVSSATGVALLTAAILTWFAALATGSAPEGLRNLSAYVLRYSGQTNAYVFLVTDVYPHASPLEGADGEPVSLAAAPIVQAA